MLLLFFVHNTLLMGYKSGRIDDQQKRDFMCIFALAFGKQIAMTDAWHRWATATSALSSNPRGSRMDTRNTLRDKKTRK